MSPGLAVSSTLILDFEETTPCASNINPASAYAQSISSASAKPIAFALTLTLVIVSSPVQLSKVEGLPANNNIDTVSLRDILGHPLIYECWAFNYCFDVDFLLEQFDEDVRETVGLTLVHGSWRKESATRVHIEDAVSRHKNVNAITAYMPEAFGTHHSKALIIFRRDELAQIVILTGNFLPQDWRMCQAVWRSPLLPVAKEAEVGEVRPKEVGQRFKFDILSYLRSYGKKLRELISQLELYDFSAIRAALIASTPCRQHVNTNSDRETLWGWLGAANILRHIPIKDTQAHIIAQVSSIASLGADDTWLRKTLFDALSRNSSPNSNARDPRFSVIFPTPDEIRRTIDGYACGVSIHMKTQSAAQARQLQYLRPLLCHWAGDHDRAQAATGGAGLPVREAGRRRTGPHIKTYLRFSDEAMTMLDWAMVTSANL